MLIMHTGVMDVSQFYFSLHPPPPFPISKSPSTLHLPKLLNIHNLRPKLNVSNYKHNLDVTSSHNPCRSRMTSCEPELI